MRSFLLGLALLPCLTAIPCSAQFQGPTVSVASTQQRPIDVSELDRLLKVARSPLAFRPGDTVSIAIYGVGGFGAPQRIEEDGTLRLPFLGTIQGAGLTVDELEKQLESQMKTTGLYQDPQVTVIADIQPWVIVTVEGDVQKPGTFPAYSTLTLIQYLSMAGGLEDNLLGSNQATNSSSSSIVTLIRPSLGHPIDIPLGPDPRHSPYASIPLLPGDDILVGRVGQVYAVGAFKYQGAYPLKNTSPTTVVQLMAQAGGIGFEGERGNTSIVRTDGDKQYVIKVNVSKILKGKMADIALQPNDIVFVPTNEMKAAIKGGGTGALVSLADTSLLVQR